VISKEAIESNAHPNILVMLHAALDKHAYAVVWKGPKSDSVMSSVPR
jgi:hypothetical protein